MQIRKLLLPAAIAIVAVCVLPLTLRAQESSINTFSPYSMYGVGDIDFNNGTTFAAMGGVGIGFANTGFDTQAEIRVNTINPASLGGMAKGRSFIFDVGLKGSNAYLRQDNATLGKLKTSFNTFNLNNITVAFPLARKLGVALNVSPYSRIGYRISRDDESNLADLGLVRYIYDGEGDMTEMKLAMGWEIAKWISVGAEFTYQWGNVNRNYQAQVYKYTGSGNYGQIAESLGTMAYTNEKISRLTGGFGVQLTPLDKHKSRLTIGAIYRLGGKLNSRVTDYIPSGNIVGDIVRFDEYTSALYMPQTIGAGVFFHRPHFAVGFDYVYQDWARKNAYDAVNNIGYVDTHTYKLGLQYTPNRRDVGVKAGNFFNRITYRLGFRYGDHYIQYGGRKIDEKAITIGLDIPFSSMKVSNVSAGFEFGERGSLRGGGVRERYFKINVGVMLFGRDYDYWFEKYRYD